MIAVFEMSNILVKVLRTYVLLMRHIVDLITANGQEANFARAYLGTLNLHLDRFVQVMGSPQVDEAMIGFMRQSPITASHIRLMTTAKANPTTLSNWRLMALENGNGFQKPLVHGVRSPGAGPSSAGPSGATSNGNAIHGSSSIAGGVTHVSNHACSTNGTTAPLVKRPKKKKPKAGGTNLPGKYIIIQ